jgi:aspartate kinase
MALIVQKYGGTSVGTIEKIGNVADKVVAHVKRGDKMVVAVSAMSGETNKLIALANEVTDQQHAREMDVLISTGEQVTIALLTMALLDRGCDARSYTGAQIRMVTDDVHGKARIKEIQSEKMKADLDADRVVVVVQIPLQSRLPRRCRRTNVRSIPMLMVFIPLTRESSQKQENLIT